MFRPRGQVSIVRTASVIWECQRPQQPKLVGVKADERYGVLPTMIWGAVLNFDMQTRALASLVLLAAIAGCAPGADQFPPACPAAQLLPQAGDLTLYRPGSSGRDLTDLALRGRVVKVAGTCQPGPTSQALDATLKVTMQLDRGPGMAGRTTPVSYFVAVARGDQILDKHIYTDNVTFPRNVDQVYLESDPVFMRIPISANLSGAAYTVWVGFQLTPQQMAANRQAETGQ